MATSTVGITRCRCDCCEELYPVESITEWEEWLWCPKCLAGVNKHRARGGLPLINPRGEKVRKAWTTREIAVVREMAAKGASSAETAAALGRSPGSVRMMWHRMGFLQQPRWTPAERMASLTVKGLPAEEQTRRIPGRTLRAIQFQRYWVKRQHSVPGVVAG